MHDVVLEVTPEELASWFADAVGLDAVPPELRADLVAFGGRRLVGGTNYDHSGMLIVNCAPGQGHAGTTEIRVSSKLDQLLHRVGTEGLYLECRHWRRPANAPPY